MRPVYADHCKLDDVSRRPLHRRIERDTLSKGFHILILGIDVEHLAAAAEHGFNVSVAPRRFHDIVLISGNAAVGFKIGLNIFLRLIDRNV